jgi:hypothetical protein
LDRLTGGGSITPPRAEQSAVRPEVGAFAVGGVAGIVWYSCPIAPNSVVRVQAVLCRNFSICIAWKMKESVFGHGERYPKGILGCQYSHQCR